MPSRECFEVYKLDTYLCFMVSLPLAMDGALHFGWYPLLRRSARGLRHTVPSPTSLLIVVTVHFLGSNSVPCPWALCGWSLRHPSWGWLLPGSPGRVQEGSAMCQAGACARLECGSGSRALPLSLAATLPAHGGCLGVDSMSTACRHPAVGVSRPQRCSLPKGHL